MRPPVNFSRISPSIKHLLQLPIWKSQHDDVEQGKGTGQSASETVETELQPAQRPGEAEEECDVVEDGEGEEGDKVFGPQTETE